MDTQQLVPEAFILPSIDEKSRFLEVTRHNCQTWSDQDKAIIVHRYVLIHQYMPDSSNRKSYFGLFAHRRFFYFVCFLSAFVLSCAYRHCLVFLNCVMTLPIRICYCISLNSLDTSDWTLRWATSLCVHHLSFTLNWLLFVRALLGIVLCLYFLRSDSAYRHLWIKFYELVGHLC